MPSGSKNSFSVPCVDIFAFAPRSCTTFNAAAASDRERRCRFVPGKSPGDGCRRDRKIHLAFPALTSSHSRRGLARLSRPRRHQIGSGVVGLSRESHLETDAVGIEKFI